MKDEIDLDKLKWEIKAMQKWSPLYKLLKRELSAQGYWKNKPRGNPKKAYRYGCGKNKI